MYPRSASISASLIMGANSEYPALRSAYRSPSGSGPSCPRSLNARILSLSFSSTKGAMARLHIGGAAPRQERQDRSDRPCAGGAFGGLNEVRREHFGHPIHPGDPGAATAAPPRRGTTR